MAGMKNEIQTIREYNAYFRTDFFLSMQCDGSSNITADSEKSYLYHSSGRTLAKCIQTKIVLNLQINNPDMINMPVTK